MPHINALIPAAGLSRRMGEFKPLLALRGKTVIENTVDTLLGAHAERVVVVLGHRGAEVEALLCRRYGARVLCVHNPHYAQSDMFFSIRLGLAALPECDAFFLLPGDMPVVSPATCEAVRRALPEDRAHIVFPTVEGRRKHPPLVGADLIPAILCYDGPDGLRGFWQAHEERILTVPVEDAGCCLDLDTPQQYDLCVQQFSDRSK